MQKRKAGTIINISSVADRNPRPQIATYAATKAAVKSLTESLRMANAKYGIRICNLAPAKIMTPMLSKQLTLLMLLHRYSNLNIQIRIDNWMHKVTSIKELESLVWGF